MDSATIARLNALNRAFYDAQAEAFADTRPRLAPGILRVLPQILPAARVLEVGCGDGKVGRWLARAGHHGAYLGVDFSAAMLARARRYSAAMPDLKFLQADLMEPDWDAALPAAPFAWILAFAVWHHLPGAATRAAALQALARHLQPSGRIVLANWQFTREPRLQRLIQPWTLLDVDPAQLEPNDYLLHWERGAQTGLRYVHLLDTTELHTLAAQARLRVAEVFQADGHSEALAEYAVLEKER